jgi:hypothetical protein
VLERTTVGTKTIGGEYPLEGRSTAAAREGNEYTPKAKKAFGQRTVNLFYIWTNRLISYSYRGIYRGLFTYPYCYCTFLPLNNYIP